MEIGGILDRMSIIDNKPLYYLTSVIECLGIGRWESKSQPCLFSLPVIENLDVFPDFSNCYLPGSVVAVMYQFLFSVPQELSMGALSK